MNDIFDLIENQDKEPFLQELKKVAKNKLDKILTFIKSFFIFIFTAKFIKIFRIDSREKALVAWFGFENDVNDVYDEAVLLERKNNVIFRIVSVTNIFYGIMVFVSGFTQLFEITVIMVITSFLISNGIKKLMSNGDNSYIKQQVVQYLWSIYIIFISSSVYIKLKTSSDNLSRIYLENSENLGSIDQILKINILESISQVGYLVIFFALVVIGLYQDKKLLIRSYISTFVIVTVMHITLMYSVNSDLFDSTLDIFRLMENEMGRYIIMDMLLKSFALFIFMVVLYGIILMNESLDKERKKELVKRGALEGDFKSVLEDVFNVIEAYNHANVFETERDCYVVGEMAKILSGLIGYAPTKQQEIYEFSICHINEDRNIKLDLEGDSRLLNEVDYTRIRNSTNRGSKIIKRLQINQKCENLVRAHVEEWEDGMFIDKMKLINSDHDSEIILLVDMYETLRSSRPFKKELSHNKSIQLLNNVFRNFFSNSVRERFMKYHLTFDKIYKRRV